MCKDPGSGASDLDALWQHQGWCLKFTLIASYFEIVDPSFNLLSGREVVHLLQIPWETSVAEEGDRWNLCFKDDLSIRSSPSVQYLCFPILLISICQSSNDLGQHVDWIFHLINTFFDGMCFRTLPLLQDLRNVPVHLCCFGKWAAWSALVLWVLRRTHSWTQAGWPFKAPTFEANEPAETIHPILPILFPHLQKNPWRDNLAWTNFRCGPGWS